MIQRKRAAQAANPTTSERSLPYPRLSGVVAAPFLEADAQKGSESVGSNGNFMAGPAPDLRWFGVGRASEQFKPADVSRRTPASAGLHRRRSMASKGPI